MAASAPNPMQGHAFLNWGRRSAADCKPAGEVSVFGAGLVHRGSHPPIRALHVFLNSRPIVPGDESLVWSHDDGALPIDPGSEVPAGNRRRIVVDFYREIDCQLLRPYIEDLNNVSGGMMHQ